MLSQSVGDIIAPSHAVNVVRTFGCNLGANAQCSRNVPAAIVIKRLVTIAVSCGFRG